MAEKPDQRVTWVDAAKGMSIALVVLAHCFSTTPGKHYYVAWLDSSNDILRLLRMPLFFCVAGFFVDRSLRLAWKPFIDKKLLLFLWLYVLWGTLRFVTTNVPLSR